MAEGDPDSVGLKKLLEVADDIIPKKLQQHAEAALDELGDTYFTVEVFEEFDKRVQYDFSRNYFPGQSIDNPDTTDDESSLVIVIAWDYLAALRVGSDQGFTDRNGNSNTLAKNYEVRTYTNEFGLPSEETTFVELYDAKPIADGGTLLRYYGQYYISLKFKNRYIFMNFTIGQLAQA